MKIAVLSGKGGTGKTLVSVNLAAAIAPSVYLDCDVEEPNGHLFFRPKSIQREAVTVKIPAVDETKCNACRTCVEFCKFHALAMVGTKWMLFDDICHSCGGCTLLCPQQALHEVEKSIGEIQTGTSEGVTVRTGWLDPGQSSGVPIIRKLFAAESPADQPMIVDCPPGSACIVMDSIRDADYCILVAEPTLFGLHNLKMVHELVRLFQKPHGVILNKCIEGDNPSKDYCLEQGITILESIPFDKTIGRLNSNGRILARELPQYHEMFTRLHQKIREVAGYETAADSER